MAINFLTIVLVDEIYDEMSQRGNTVKQTRPIIIHR